MAHAGEKDREAEKNQRDETVALPPNAPGDPDATVAAAPDPDATRPAGESGPGFDPDATRLADAGPTSVLDDALPTLVVPPEEGGTLPDGLDVMDDPYYAPATTDELTSASAPVSIPSPVQSLPERRRRLPGWAVALVVVVLLALGGGAAYYTYDQELWGGKTVPAVVGMTQDEATRALEELGFAVDVEAVVTDDEAGVVLACDPEPGTRADPAAGAVLSVSSERVIPKVIGLDEEAALRALVAAGAQDIRSEAQGSSEPAGTVIGVTPGEGEPFAADDPVTLVVARSFTVPNVLGLSLEEAQALLAESGLTGSVAYVDSTDERGTVVEASPSVGAEVEEGATVELRVATRYPNEPYDLLAYFELPPVALVGYLEQEGFSLEYGEVFAATGNAHAAYSGPAGEVLQISDYPETGRSAAGSRADVLSEGTGVGGVRYAFSADTLPEGGASVSEEGLRAVMRACGFDDLLDTCTQDDVALPDGGDAESEGEGPHFICGSGSQGEYVWAVVIGGTEGRTSVVALAAPAAHFDEVDLTPFGGSICDYVAYASLYEE